MSADIVDLRDFYATPLGRTAREAIRGRLREIWPDLAGLRLAGIGYATPYLRGFAGEAERVLALMPAGQGVMRWPPEGPNLAALVDEAALPLPDASVDRILVVHALEHAEQLRQLLREVWRVLAPPGRVIVAVAARDGLWANSEATPFGHGRPYSRRQLAALLREAELEPAGYTRALYVPPAEWLAGSAETFETVGARVWPRFSGVLLMEAVKQTYAIKARPVRARVRRARPVLSPLPAPAPGAARNRRDGSAVAETPKA